MLSSKTTIAVATTTVLLAGIVGSQVSLGGAATRSDCGGRFPTVIRDGFPQPPMRFSKNGRLDTRLRMKLGTAKVDGHSYRGAMTYEGSFPGPTLVVCPGDDVRVKLVNRLAKGQVTNLHVHGLHVSPRSRGDNVFRHLSPGRSQTYDYELPADHEPGAYWYHPHHHMFVAPQIFAGLSGAIVVRGGLDRILRDVPQRLMMIQSTELCDRNGRSVAFPTATPGGSGTESCKPYAGSIISVAKTNERFTPLLVNGAINPTVKIRPGEIQRWRIFNANDNRIVVLNLRGQDLQVLAEDGNTLRWRRPMTNLQIAPGSRREVLVRGGDPGRYALTALPFAQFPTGDKAVEDKANKGGGPTPGQRVLTVVSAGSPKRDALPRGPFAEPVDLRTRHADRRRTICFNERPQVAMDHSPHDAHAMAAMGAHTMTTHAGDATCQTPPEDPTAKAFDFLINGTTFDPDHIAATIKLNSVEEWTLINANTEWHTFHIHVNPFQVLSTDGRRVPFVDYEDNVALPPQSKVVIRMNPVDFTGKFVIHCHVANHEDRGMMAAVQVVR